VNFEKSPPSCGSTDSIPASDGRLASSLVEAELRELKRSVTANPVSASASKRSVGQPRERRLRRASVALEFFAASFRIFFFTNHLALTAGIAFACDKGIGALPYVT
jgi:hypothetical protein